MRLRELAHSPLDLRDRLRLVHIAQNVAPLGVEMDGVTRQRLQFEQRIRDQARVLRKRQADLVP